MEEMKNTAVEVESITEVGHDIQKEKIRNLVSGIYDIQKLRIAIGNRVVQSFNIQMGQKPSESQEDMEKEAQSMIKTLRSEYKRITDAYINKSYIKKVKTGENTEEKTVTLAKNAGIEKIISVVNEDKDLDIQYIKNKLDYELMGTYVDILETEERMTKVLSKEVEKHPMWDKFFKDVKGCGPLMAAVCIAYFDVHKARHVSSFWKYAGLDTVDVALEDGTHIREGRGKKHTEMVQYTDKDGNIKEKRSITYNPELKTKLLGVLGGSFLKKPGCKYEKTYRDYRNRLDNRADSNSLSALRKHRMANRYMIKQFVRDLWVTWRAYEGYEVSEPYEVAVLGRNPHHYNEYHTRMAKHQRRMEQLKDRLSDSE